MPGRGAPGHVSGEPPERGQPQPTERVAREERELREVREEVEELEEEIGGTASGPPGPAHT